MNNKVTKFCLKYPLGFEPNYVNPQNYDSMRFGLGKEGENPLIVICMNPSAASDNVSDLTINRIIRASQILNMNGWIVFNTYPERATDSKNLSPYSEELALQNIEIIKEYLLNHNIKEVCGAWGNSNNGTLEKAKIKLIDMLKSIGVKVFYFGTLTKNNNPKHPLQRSEKIIITNENKKYLY